MLAYYESLSNWGRWGDDDELGTLNLITPEKRRAAAALVREGISVGCARPILAGQSGNDVRTPPLHMMVKVGDDERVESGSADFMAVAPHGSALSHIDTLAHHFWKGKMFNGRSHRLVSTEHRARAGSVETMKDGIVTRGVLLDITTVRGKPSLGPGEAIYSRDLEAAERSQGVVVGSGDALLVRTGFSKWREEKGAPPATPLGNPRPGLHAETLPWLRARDIAVVAADASHDVHPSGYAELNLPIHGVGIAAMGLCLIDACQFEDLAAACALYGRWDFLFVVAPWRFRGATGAPVTPIAVL